ncbi:hypothetical protein [Spelaeicoccus albus]|uniref:Uncharacterized protein n=1 Tax=Spelaeicoccus albus TaxID=1280376 RepID=A0A7Z0D216_9MICO|nr:hypothetical protein [Spelaeicoccus albus]NYI67421.1 hypothetical protein [Spelaeicoccus albus]
MALFGKRRRDELGRGAWRHDHDRFGRAVDRFYAIVGGIDTDRKPDGTCASREALAALTGDLGQAADRVHGICVRAERLAPTDGMALPGGAPEFMDVQRNLSRAATAVAQAAQAAFMVRAALRTGEPADAEPAVRAVREALDLVDRAERLLNTGD